MVTRRLTCTGDALEINDRTGAVGDVRIEMQDAAGTPLAGKPVRLRFILADADVFSFGFR